MSVPPIIKRLPSQSIAFRPAHTGVFGVSRSRKNTTRISDKPSKGTDSDEQAQRTIDNAITYG